MSVEWHSSRIGYRGRYGRAVHRARRKAGLPTNRPRNRDRRVLTDLTLKWIKSNSVQWTRWVVVVP